MKRFSALSIIVILLALPLLAFGADANETIIEVSQPKKTGKFLGTSMYSPTEKEAPFAKKVTEKPLNFFAGIKVPEPVNKPKGSGKKKKAKPQKEESKSIAPDQYTLSSQVGEYVGWFGIVRQKTWDEKTKQTTMLVEHHFFDGLTDVHLQVASIFGAGDFKATVTGEAKEIPLLSLICIYGKVAKGSGETPEIASDYIRVWDWGLFTFMDYGPDKSNKAWTKLRTIKTDDVYSSKPDKKYYVSCLGERENPKAETKKK